MSKHIPKHRWRFRGFLQATEGTSALEYALVVGIIIVGVGAAIIPFGESIKTAIIDLAPAVTNTVSNLPAAPVP